MATSVPTVTSRMHIRYYFSTDCSQCERSKSFVSELSREYPVDGMWSGNKHPGPVRFSLKKSTQADKERYIVTDEPTIVILKDGLARQVIRGELDILSSRTIIKGIEQGALTVSEAIEQGPKKKYKIAGWIVSRGEYFKESLFFVTDRKQSIAVRPWLPLEAARSSFKKTRPRLMSDVIGKPVFLEGTLTKNGDNLQFMVGKELSFE
jgi:hypothetical protein